MKKHFIVITSDANRYTLKTAYCQDVDSYLLQLNLANNLTISYSSPHRNRIVYIEGFSTREEAEQRRNQINLYTKMQKEKLIRRKNPNWLSIHFNAIQTNADRPHINC